MAFYLCGNIMTSCAHYKYVLIFEGTGNDDNNPSSMSRLYDMIEDVRTQRKHIEFGSGTNGGWFARFFYSVTGCDTFDIVAKQLRWLVEHLDKTGCRPADAELYIFGFSRGAYQARIFSRMVSLYGIPRTAKDVAEFVESYRKTTRRFFVKEMKKPCTDDIHIVKLLGIIDTVSSVFSPWHVVQHEISAEKCYHAVAIHESRMFFRPKLIEAKSGCVEQKWFAGAHSDVGWAYNGTRKHNMQTSALGEIVLHWMVSKIGDGLTFIYAPYDLIHNLTHAKLMLEHLWLLMHDSSKCGANLWGVIPPKARDVDLNNLHESVDMIREVSAIEGVFPRMFKESLFYALGSLSESRKMFLTCAAQQNEIVRRVDEKWSDTIVPIICRHGLRHKDRLDVTLEIASKLASGQKLTQEDQKFLYQDEWEC